MSDVVGCDLGDVAGRSAGAWESGGETTMMDESHAAARQAEAAAGAAPADEREANRLAAPSLGRVMLLTAGVGGGHLRAAQAVDAALRRGAAGGEWTAQSMGVVDVLDHAAAVFRAAYRDGYLALIRRTPALLGWLYRRSDVPWRGGGVRSLVNRLALGRLRRLLRRENPDLVISTHFLSSEFVAWMKSRGEIDSRLATVVTDMDVHGLWFCRPCEHFLVATEEAREILIAGGIGQRRGGLGDVGARIDVTGIPIDPRFASLPSRSEARAALGLPADRPVVLFCSGGVGTGRLEEIFRQLLRVRLPAHIVAICGRNPRAERALKEVARACLAQDGPSAQVLGFTERMHDWMAAADLLVGKPGGLTSSEARAAGLPMVVVDPVPGQEERNADHLLEWGVAVKANNLSTLGWRIGALLGDQRRLEAMRQRAEQLARPDSAREVCRLLADAAAERRRGAG